MEVGFWPDHYTPFSPVPYLCTESVYYADPAECAYAFRPQELEIAEQMLQEAGLQWELLAYCPGSDIYLYTSDTALMQAF